MLNALYATPRVAMIPLILIWFGIGMWSKVFIVFISAFFPILVNTVGGMRAIDRDLLRAARAFCASDWQIFKTVAIPGSVPFILTGIRQGVALGLIGVVVGEMFGGSEGSVSWSPMADRPLRPTRCLSASSSSPRRNRADLDSRAPGTALLAVAAGAIVVPGPSALVPGPSLVPGPCLVPGPWSCPLRRCEHQERESRDTGPGTTKDQARTRDQAPGTKDE